MLPAGDPDIVDIFAAGPYGPIGVPIIIRNNTDATLTNLHVLATIRDPDGHLIAAEDSAVVPTIIPPGGIGFDRVPYWSDLPEAPPGGSVYAFDSYETSPGFEGRVARSVPLTVLSAEVSGNQLIGRARNTTNETISYGPSVLALCFTQAGEAVEMFGAPIDIPIQPIAPRNEFPFSLDIEGTCDRFLVAVSVIVI